MSYSCCFSTGGNLEFPDFLQKSFITLAPARPSGGPFRDVEGPSFDRGFEFQAETKCFELFSF